MNRLFTEMKFNKRATIFVTFVTIVFLLSRITSFIEATMGNERNMCDFIFYFIDDYFFITYFTSLMFLILIYYISKNHILCKYCVLKYESKTKWYMHQLGMIMYYAIFFTVTIIFICILIGFGKFSFNNKSIYISNIVSLKDKEPILLLLINAVFFTLYLCLIGFIYFISNLRFKHNILGTMSTVVIVVSILNVIPYENRNPYLYKFNIANNIILSSHNYIKGINQPSFTFSMFYFVVLIVLVIAIGYFYVKKCSIGLEDKQDE